MAWYHFVTVVSVRAPGSRVWEELTTPERWPTWWRYLRRVDVLREGDPEGVGARYRHAYRTALPYTLAFEWEVTRREDPRLITTRASGELDGVAWFDLAEEGDVTRVRIMWIVRTTKGWMNLLAPFGRPVFAWNHDILMRDFAEGLARAVDGELTEFVDVAVPPRHPRFGRLPDGTVVT